MSKFRRKDARHVRLYAHMTRTPAWRSLNGNERATYLLLAERYMGLNNGTIPLSVREVSVELRVSQATACRCLQRLQDRGFLVAMVKGGFNVKRRLATAWRLTEHTCNVSGHAPTGEYRNWRPDPDPDPKIQNTGSVVKPNGFRGETVVAEMPRDGFRGETVKAPKSISRSHHGSTLSYQLPPAKDAPAPAGASHPKSATVTVRAQRCVRQASSVRR